MTVKLDKVAKVFGAVQVLHDLDLDVAEGEFLVLLGASGSGKTTALRMIAGLESVTSGTITIAGRDVTNVLPKNRDVAMVFQSYALYPHKTVAENIGYPLRIRGMGRADRDAAVRFVAAQVQLESLLDRYPRQLSGGQRQRVALARAMVRRPKAFLMDEPLSNLDAKLRGHMRAELKHMQHTLGITTIYVTHDQVEAMTLAHRVALLEDGKLMQLGTPRTIYNDPDNLFVAGFIGSPPMNMISGELDNGVFVKKGARIRTGIFGSCPSVVFGVRPEDGEIVAEQAASVQGELFAIELIGDHSLVTVTTGEDSITVKAPKDFHANVGDRVGVRFFSDRQYLFEGSTGQRMR